MFAVVELDDEVRKFIDYAKNHNESFEEMKELVFTHDRLEQDYTMVELLNLSFIFQKIKGSALEKVLNNEQLNFSEGFVFERLIAKYENSELLTVEEHMNQIKKDCSSNRKEKRENEKKFNKLYKNFMKMFSN